MTLLFKSRIICLKFQSENMIVFDFTDMVKKTQFIVLSKSFKNKIDHFIKTDQTFFAASHHNISLFKLSLIFVQQYIYLYIGNLTYIINYRLVISQYFLIKMIKSINLTQHAITSMLNITRGEKQSFIVQVSHLKKVKQEKYMKVRLNDGTESIKAIINVSKPTLDLYQVGTQYGDKPTYLIAVIEHITHNFEGNKILEIVNFIPLQPQQKKASSESGDETEKKQRKNYDISKENEQLMEQISAPPKQQPILIIEERQLKDYQKITDLYTDFQGWQIVVRVLDTCYKEFNSKSGKLTKICTVRLIDRSGVKIQATMFGQQAKDLHSIIKQDQVYKISRGQIKENGYNQYKDDNVSKYTIILTRNSQIARVQDIKSIPRANESIITLSQVLNQMNFQKQYDILVVLIQIGEEKSIQKEGKTIYKRNIVVGDPEVRKSMEVLIWGRNIMVNYKMIGKPILIKNFRLNTYRDQLSLSSTFKSEVVIKDTNKYDKLDLQRIEYSSVSTNQKDQQKQAPTQVSVQKCIRDIQNQIIYMKNNENLISDLQFYVSFINFKNKWYYGACNNPKCKKQTDHHSRCLFCGTFNEAIVNKYILPIEITDFTGSLWTTAFDDFANEIFKNTSLENLIKLSDLQLKEEGEKRLYQQYRGRISTKRSEDGTIRHSFIGKPSELTIEKVMLSNLEKIKRAVY